VATAAGPLDIVIRGVNLPGTRCSDGASTYENVHVALQVGREPSELVPADAPSAEWRTPVTLVEKDAGLDFRGPAVQGRRGERFLYLTWGEVVDGEFRMFRRAKLMLADIPDEVVAAGWAVAEVDLTDDCGMPRCARVLPPDIAWTT